jgi:hypothetical protein
LFDSPFESGGEAVNDLVRRLSEGRHPVEVSLRPERTVKALKECLDRGYVHIRFTSTRGGTVLGVPIDLKHSRLNDADFDSEVGSLTIAGQLSLDFVDVRCVAEIALPSMQGEGYLVPVEEERTATT